MPFFSEKLNSLIATVETASTSGDIQPLAEALRAGRQRLAVAVGSGGSAIAAEYLAVCRRTLQAAPTLVQTPLEFLIGEEQIGDADVWLFSAGGSNPDILSGLNVAQARGYRRLHVVTRGHNSPLAEAAAQMPAASVYVAPTADPRDGFLATHSLIAVVTGLLLAADRCAPGAQGKALAHLFLERACAMLGQDVRDQLAAAFASLTRSDTVFVLQDPRLAPVARLIETSAWEAALCAVQRTDFRNFAHGRHVWLGHRAERSLIVALTGIETRRTWDDIRELLPQSLRIHNIDLGNCGRLQNAFGIVMGLCLVEAFGHAVGIDPGRPGTASFAEGIFEAPSLLELSGRLTPSVRQKRAAVELRDDPVHHDRDLAAAFCELLARLDAARFNGLVVDYDGTMVTLEGRYDQPSTTLIAEFERLLGEGLRLAVATGRGGSAGVHLRKALPECYHREITISYYNGGWTLPLSVDLDDNRPPSNPLLDNARAWLAAANGFIAEREFRDSGVQLTIKTEALADSEAFVHHFNEEVNGNGELRIVWSFHTLDICPAQVCKTSTAHCLAQAIDVSLESILCIGDSGSVGGNDYALLGLPHGLSVGQVCDRPDACWSIFGALLSGPDALLTILRALRSEPSGGHRLHAEALDPARKAGTRCGHPGRGPA